MALFLNTPKFNYWLPKLIESSKEELILIVPYISISQNILNALKKASLRNVQIVIIYRENKLYEAQKEILKEFENLTLLHHPHIHCKCYFNGDLLIVGSMNLYEYSENNNREMGVLFSVEDLEEIFPNEEDMTIGGSDSILVFIDAKKEISEILNGSSLDKASSKFKESQLHLQIIESNYDQCLRFCQELSKGFFNKKFEPISCDNNDLFYSPICENFYDRIDVIWDDNRWSIIINESDSRNQEIFKIWKASYQEFEFKGFKYYWNKHDSDIMLYADRNNYDWDGLVTTQEKIIKWKEGLNMIIKKYRKITNR